MSRTGSGTQSTSAGSKRGRPSMDGSAAKRRPGRQQQADEVGSEAASTGDDEDEEEEDEQKTIPPELLTRLLHEFFTKDGSRITRDANEAVAKYMDVFVREAIARSAAESEGKFMEVSFFFFNAQKSPYVSTCPGRRIRTIPDETRLG